MTYRGICRIKEDNLQPGTFYARVIVGETRDLETKIPNIVAKTALSGTDVKAVIDALTAEVIAALAHQAGTTGRTGHQCPGYRTTPRERGWTGAAGRSQPQPPSGGFALLARWFTTGHLVDYREVEPHRAAGQAGRASMPGLQDDAP